MSDPIKQRYQERLKRYTTAMRNEKPDRVPIRPFVAEFTAKYAGYTCQEVTQDLELAFKAARKCAADFDWDAVVPNMVAGWAGMSQAMGMKYYSVPGIDLPPDIGFQYREPSEAEAYLQPEEYDLFSEDPTGFLFNVWLPRVSSHVHPPGELVTYRHNLSLLKGGMAMMHYFNATGRQVDLLREETGTVSAVCGILKAPLDILADKLRGYVGLAMDLHQRRQKVITACEALMPHMLHVALSSADPNKQLPVTAWLHRSCVPFISFKDFEEIFWPTFKPLVLELWARGHQVLCYAEGKWGAHLKAFAELPAGSIIYHVDRDDIFAVHKAIGHKFCLSGGIPNDLLSFGMPGEVRDYCWKLIAAVAREGGYILDAGAIMQNDTSVENVKVMTESAREYGAYRTHGRRGPW